MFKQSPSRNHRSKGFKVKRFLHISVLFAICFWLVYQVKHSHDKKKAFDESNGKISTPTHINDEIVNFGRKGLHPRFEEMTMDNDKHDEEEAEEEEIGGGEQEDNKHEEEEQDPEQEEDKEGEGRGGGDDEIDERDQVKSEVEVEHEEDLIDEGKEREEGDEKEIEEKDVEDKDSQDETENHDGGSRNAHEAREEQYRADDASSAVTHETESANTENERGKIENSSKNTEMNIQEVDNEVNNGEEMTKGQNTTNNSVLSSTMTMESNSNISMEQDTESGNSSVEIGTEAKNAVGDHSSSASNNSNFDSNVVTSNDNENAEVATVGSNFSTTSGEDTNATQNEKSAVGNETNEKDESSDSFKTENLDEFHPDLVDFSDSDIQLEEKDVRTDLDTLPEIGTEGSDNEDAAAE